MIFAIAIIRPSGNADPLRRLPPAAGGGNLTETILANLGRIEHFESADCPGRHQPGTGEINYRFVLDAIDRAGFDGWGLSGIRAAWQHGSLLGWLLDRSYRESKVPSVTNPQEVLPMAKIGLKPQPLRHLKACCAR